MSINCKTNCFYGVAVVLLLANLLGCSLGCPERCLCYRTNAGPTVRCNHQNLRRIPEVPTSTVVLDLRFNQIKEIKRGDLAGLHHLTTLLLSTNRITTVEANALTGLSSLKYLYLYNNAIKDLSASLFKGLTRLEQLYLHFNLIPRLPSAIFRGLTHLERLYIHHNKLKTLPNGLFQDLTSLKRLRLDSNQLVCDCDLLWLSLFLRRTPNTETAATCFEPLKFSGRPVVRIRPLDLDCSSPRTVKTPASIDVTVSDSQVEFKCNVVGEQSQVFSWYKDRRPLPQGSRYVTHGDGILHVRQPTLEDEGVYTCLVNNDRGEQVAEASVRYDGVDVVPSLTHYPQAKFESIAGNTVTMLCRATGKPVPVIRWFKDGIKISSGSRVKITVLGDLQITSTRSEDQGHYECYATNKVGSTVARTKLEVTTPPRFLFKPSNTEVLEGSTASLVCRAEGFPTPAIAWTKDGDRLPSQERHIVLPSGSLRIIHARAIDEGQYECRAINLIAVSTARAFLTVAPRVPPQITKQPNDQTVTTGQTVQMSCAASGSPHPMISWLKDDVHITEGNRYSTSQLGVLTIRDVTKADEGRYECAARNSIGIATALMVLSVDVSHPVFIGDKFVNESIDEAISSVDRALKSSIRKLFRSSRPRSPSDLLALFRFPSPQAQQIARAAEVFERTIQLVHEHVAEINMVNVTDGKSTSYFDLLSPAYINMIANLSGCHAHRQKDNCTNLCFHLKYRSADGTCNNLQHAMWGASLTPFKRLLNPVYENGFNEPIGWSNQSEIPSARLVSREIISASNVTDDSKYTHMLMQWGQFLDHDIDFTVTSLSFSRFHDGTDCTATCENNNPCFPIQIPKGDPRITRARCMQFTRSSPVCGTGTTSVFFSNVHQREQMNQITSFIDGSNIYGSSDDEASNLRNSRSRGLLKTSPAVGINGKPLLPFNTDSPIECLQPHDSPVPCFLAGDFRANEQLGLLSMHTLWMREHNRIAKELGHLNPHWNEDKIYHEARKIVGAELQHITFNNWLPKVIGPRGMKLIGAYQGYDPNVESSIANSFATAAFRFGHSLINPIIFRLNSTFQAIEHGNIPLHKAFFSPYKIVNEGGIDPVLRGLFGTAAKSPKDKSRLLNSELTERLFEMAHAVALDLGALNIQRGRDHALPGYNAWRSLCNLTTADTFDELKNEITNPEIRNKLKKLYRHPSDVDLWVAGLLEDMEPGARIGKVFTCLIADQFKRLRAGDRFWYENPTTFDQNQLTQIRQTSLARVLCDNGDNIQHVQRDVFRRVGYPSGYVSCSSIPKLDLRLWKDCCGDEECRVADQSFTLSANLRSRFKRSAGNNDNSPKQSNAFYYGKTRPPLMKAYSPKRKKKIAVRLFEALKPDNRKEERAKNRKGRKLQNKKLKMLSNKVNELERTVLSMAQTLGAMQSTIETLKNELKRRNNGQ